MEARPAPPDASLARTAAWYVLFAALFNLGFSGLMSPATDFLLKDGFRLGPEAMARYGALVALPGYGAFLYGYARDRLAPRLGGDRGVMRLGHGALALAFGALAFVGPTYGGLVGLAVAASVLSSFTVAGLNGALVTFGKRRAVADRLSGFLLAVGAGTGALVSLAGGWAAAHLAFRTILALMAAINVAAALWLIFAPRGSLAPAEAPPAQARRTIPLAEDFARLARDRAFLVALGLGMLRGLGLVSGTVTFYELTSRLKAGPEALGGSGALGGLVMAGVGLLYLRFARRTTLRRALALGIVLGAPGPLFILLIRSPADLFPLAVWGGIVGTFYSAPLGELLMRSMPSESAGLGYALNGTLAGLSAQASNLLGTWVYARYGIETCVALSLPLPLLSLLLVALVPRGLVGRAETPRPV